MRSVWAAALLLRRARADRGSLALLFAVIATTSFLFAAAPRVFSQVADDGLRMSLLAASPAERDVKVTGSGRITPGPGSGVGGPTAGGDRFASAFPASVAALISSRTMVITSVRLNLDNPQVDQSTTIYLRYQDGLTDATRLVSGRWPVSHGIPLRTVALGPRAPTGDDAGNEPPVVVEAALSVDAAASMGVRLGDRLPISVGITDPLVAGTAYGTTYAIAPAEVLVVGLYAPNDANDAVWSGDTSLLRVFLTGSPLAPTMNATAYISGAEYADLYPGAVPFRYEWRFHVDPGRLDAGQVDMLQADLERLTHNPDLAAGRTDLTSQVWTGLPAILARFATQLTLTVAVLSFVVFGPIALAAGAIAMLASLLARRRASGMVLAAGRGASGSLLIGAHLWEAILVAGSGALVGLWLAIAAVPARESRLSSIAAVATAVASIALLAWAAWSATRRPPGPGGQRDRRRLRVGGRRAVIELTVVGIAVGGAVLLSQRGLLITAPGQPTRFDPLLAAVPVLGGTAAGILAMRLFPLPASGLGWLAARRRDLVPVLGLRSIERDPAASSLPLLVLLVAAAFATFSSVIVSSIERGEATAAAITVGADFRIEAAGTGTLPPASVFAALPGVEAVAPAFVDAAVPFTSGSYQYASIYFDAVDPDAYAAVTAGTAAEPTWPAAFIADPPSAGAGSAASPIPAILSSRRPAGSARLVEGDTFGMTVAGHPLTFTLVEQRATFAGLGSQPTFAVVPLGWLEAALGGGALAPTAMWVRAPAGVAASLASTTSTVAGPTRIVSRYDVYDGLRDAPLVSAVAVGYGLAGVVAALYMALAFIGAIVLSAARRSRDLSYLRTLGISRAQALALTVVEQGPAVLVALMAGGTLGVVTAISLEPAMGLNEFVGIGSVPPTVDWVSLALMVGALTVVVLTALVVGTWLARRTPMMESLRIGDA